MTYETAILSGAAHELRVRTFGGTIVSRHSASRHPDGRYVFCLGVSEEAVECHEPGSTNVDSLIIKGHRKTPDGVHYIVDNCRFCKRNGKVVVPGQEVKAWLQQMPQACQEYWQTQGCDGSGSITVGGDEVQGYFVDCKGCTRCTPSELSPYDDPALKLDPEAYEAWLARLRQDPDERGD